MMIAALSQALMSAASLIGVIAFVGLAVIAMIRRRPFRHPAFLASLMAMAVWLMAVGWLKSNSAVALALEGTSNLCWLWFMATLADRGEGRTGISAVGWIYIGLFALQLVVVAAILVPLALNGSATNVVGVMDRVQMLFAAGGLVLLHNLFDASHGDERQALIWPLAALGVLWGYALNLNAISYLSGQPAGIMETLRPMVAVLAAVLIAVAALRPGARAVHLSRPVVFRSLAVIGVVGWLGLLSVVALLVTATGNDFGGFAQITVLAGTLVGAGLFLLSPRMRARLRVWAAKNFYAHRYDYRAEWLRFTATLNRPEVGDHSIAMRVIEALADVVECPSGLMVDATSGHAGVVASWPINALVAQGDDWQPLAEWMERSLRIVQFDEIRNGNSPAEEMTAVPKWLLDDPKFWIAVPLVHGDRIEAIVVLARPPLDRLLDWEDFDMMRVAGRQAASHIAEARGSEALAEAARFEEFHRRFAFMMHDVKNLASQMALLSYNTERHGANPEFRQDMVTTLRVCAERLGQLMQRLSQQERVHIDRLSPVDLTMVANTVADLLRGQHRVDVTGLDSAMAVGDHPTIEQLLIHLVQNSIDASGADVPVLLRISRAAGEVRISVEDSGVGMSPEFVRTQLFRPFHSTKPGGFGIGAYQARQLAEAMNGTLSVSSCEGVGTVFTLTLVEASMQHSAENQSEAA